MRSLTTERFRRSLENLSPEIRSQARQAYRLFRANPRHKQGETLPGHATVAFQRGETVVIFKEVPAEVCANCGEHYLSESVTGELLERAEKAIENGAKVEILRFAA